MELGGQAFSNVPAFTEPDTSLVPEDPPAWWPESDGTIGREFLKQFFVVIDYPGSSVALYDYDKEPEGHACNGPRMPLVDHAEGVIVKEVELDHGPVTAIWEHRCVPFIHPEGSRTG